MCKICKFHIYQISSHLVETANKQETSTRDHVKVKIFHNSNQVILVNVKTFSRRFMATETVFFKPVNGRISNCFWCRQLDVFREMT